MMAPNAKETLLEIERRFINSFLDILILLILHSQGGELSGYDIIKHLQADYGFLVSPGTVYSCLSYMERDGLLRGTQNGKKRVYFLTEEGTKTAQTILDARDKFINFISIILHTSCNVNLLSPQLSIPFSSKESLPDA
jgi:DNA-binding PadR family transcriptional regulator